MDEIEQVALRAARAAGRIHLRWLNKTRTTRKSNALDLVTEADKEAEAAIIARIRRVFPTHGSSRRKAAPANRRASIDGSSIRSTAPPTSRMDSRPSCVSVAYEHRGRVQFGAVFDALHKDLFAARRGKGATLNGKPMRVSKAKTLATALLATGFPYDRRERRRFYLCFWEDMMTRVEGVRRAGSAALDLASVASGRLDGFWEFGLKPWDVAAGALLVKEAGGRVTNMDGSPLDLAGAQILATNGKLHREMEQVLREIRPEAERRHLEMLRDDGKAS